MRTKIYQINSKRDVNRVKFEGLDLLERYQGSSAVDPSYYKRVVFLSPSPGVCYTARDAVDW